MKKLILLFLVLVLKFSPAKAQWVTIPDANFVTFLNQNYASCMNGNQMDTTCVWIVNETTLLAYNRNISNLYGVQYFDNLLELFCNGNQLSTLPALPNSLTLLNFSSNQFTDLPTLPNNLTSLDCGVNQLDTLPALPNSLTNLTCNDNQFTNLPTLPNNLTHLICGANPLSSLPALPNSLNVLDCRDIPLGSLPVLPNALIFLNCSGNQLNSLPALPNSLGSLRCSNNQLTSLPALPNSLYSLYCGFNQLSSLPTLPNSLRYVWFNNNQLSSLPTLPNILLQLYCSYNQLSSLPPLPNSLPELDCSHNQFSSLPALPNSLTYLDCSHNQLSSLPALPNSLNYLRCNNNQLSSLPEVPSTMTIFDISNNNISCLVNLPLIDIGSISNNLLTCVPNLTNYSGSLPLCLDSDPINNPNNCTGVNITGTVYKDLNYNCALNTTDLRVQNLPVKLYDNQNNFLAQSYTINGVYSFNTLLPDTYQVKIQTINSPIAMSCGQTSTRSVTLNTANQTIQNINFPVVCGSNYDATVQSVSTNGWVFPGQTHTLRTNVTNNSNWYNLNCTSSIVSGTVSIQVNGPVSFVAPAAGALTPSFSGNTFTYNISNFTTLNSNSFGLQLMTDTTAQATDQVCVHVEISPSPIDADTTNNVYDFCYNVLNSYDPNMKEVYPVDVLPGYDDWFTYTIHFQNTGNAPAFNIRLRDTLDTQLDLNTFEVLGYSHPANVGLSGNILTVRFNNILLPDSTSDYEGSMGYFQYRIKPNGAMLNGSQISNTAYIYFDYNAPIITNTTQNNFFCSPVTSSLSYTICLGDSVQVGNNWYSSAGNYTNSFVTPVGCDSIVNTLITETSIDTSVVLTGNTLNAVSGYSNYSWIDCSTGLEIEGENSNELVAPYAGFFKSVITSTDGCVSESSCIGVILTGNETKLYTNTQTFEIYPNPSSGIFTFKDTKNIQRVEVYNVLGQEIAVFVGDNTNKVSKQINLSSYSKGIYFAKINGSVVLKMVKE